MRPLDPIREPLPACHAAMTFKKRPREPFDALTGSLREVQF